MHMFDDEENALGFGLPNPFKKIKKDVKKVHNTAKKIVSGAASHIVRQVKNPAKSFRGGPGPLIQAEIEQAKKQAKLMYEMKKIPVADIKVPPPSKAIKEPLKYIKAIPAPKELVKNPVKAVKKTVAVTKQHVKTLNEMTSKSAALAAKKAKTPQDKKELETAVKIAEQAAKKEFKRIQAGNDKAAQIVAGKARDISRITIDSGYGAMVSDPALMREFNKKRNEQVKKVPGVYTYGGGSAPIIKKEIEGAKKFEENIDKKIESDTARVSELENSISNLLKDVEARMEERAAVRAPIVDAYISQGMPPAIAEQKAAIDAGQEPRTFSGSTTALAALAALAAAAMLGG